MFQKLQIQLLQGQSSPLSKEMRLQSRQRLEVHALLRTEWGWTFKHCRRSCIVVQVSRQACYDYRFIIFHRRLF